MTPLQSIIETIENAGFDYAVGYGGDILSFLEMEEMPSRSFVFVQIGPERPARHDSAGKATQIIGSFTLWMRRDALKGDEADIYTQYAAMRDELDGKPYDDGKVLKLVEGVPQIAGGIGEPQISIEAYVR